MKGAPEPVLILNSSFDDYYYSIITQRKGAPEPSGRGYQDLRENILLAGGGSKIRGLEERLVDELTAAQGAGRVWVLVCMVRATL